MAIKKTPWWSRQTKSNDKKKKTQRKPWGWRDKPKSKPKQKKESFLEKDLKEQGFLKEKKTKSNDKVNSWIPDFGKDEPKSKPKQKKESFWDRQDRKMKEVKSKAIKETGVEEPNSRPKETSIRGRDKSEPVMRVIRRHKKNDNCYAFNIKRKDGSEFWKVLTNMPDGRNQRDRDKKIIAATGGKIFKNVSEVDNWCESQVERPRNTRKLSKDTIREARNRFFKEMKHEGIKLTSLGKKVEKDNYRKSESSTEYTNRNMKYFSGNKEQEGKYWVRAKKPSKSRRNRRDRRDRRDRRGRRGRRVRRGRRERRDRDEPEPVVESQGGTSVVGESKPRTKDQERRKFFEEMKHEGYELTEEGKRNEKDAYHSAKDADSYRKYVYRMARDEKMYIKVGKSSSTEMEMAAEYCSRDFGTKAGDWFARF